MKIRTLNLLIGMISMLVGVAIGGATYLFPNAIMALLIFVSVLLVGITLLLGYRMAYSYIVRKVNTGFSGLKNLNTAIYNVAYNIIASVRKLVSLL